MIILLLLELKWSILLSHGVINAPINIELLKFETRVGNSASMRTDDVIEKQ